MSEFKLSNNFLQKYAKKQPKWGPLGFITYKSKYARPIEKENRTEEWVETIQRVVEGTYQVQKTWCEKHRLSWNGIKAQRSAQVMFSLMFDFKFLPPGRGLWMMGTKYIKERKTSAPLFNCSFVSTKDLKVDFADPFCFLMDMSMLGVGVGFDTEGSNTLKIKNPRKGTYKFTIEDNREAWVEITRIILDSYIGKGTAPGTIDYSKIRPHGSVIKSFGGTASGPEPLRQLLEKDIPEILNPLAITESCITSSAIVDIFNAIGRCVVAGNTRRSAEIALGHPDDIEFLNLKDKNVHPDFYDEDGNFIHPWRWASNNTILANIGMDYTDIVKRTVLNGEPGYEWLENARKYGRLCDPINNVDKKVCGTNPCITGNTLIALADGRNAVSIKQLANEGKDIPVYSVNIDTGKVSIQWARNPRITKKNTQVVEITLDDGSCLKVTPDHNIILRGGIKVQAKNLKPGDSLSRFTKVPEKIAKNNTNQYFRVNCDTLNSQIDKIYEHKLIAKFFNKEQEAFHIQNKDKLDIKALSLVNQALEQGYETKIINNKVFVEKICECCNKNFYTKYLVREISFCSDVCSNKYKEYTQSRQIGLQKSLSNRQSLVLEKQINAFTTLSKQLKRNPLKMEWESYCKNNDIPFRCRSKTIPWNPYVLKNYQDLKTRASQYNHKVCSIKYLDEKEDVYNLTVDKNHTVGIVTSIKPNKYENNIYSGIFITQCGEISLESYEFCNVPETFPGLHDSYKEYELTLKYAYLYGKTVSLMPTHNSRANAVQLRNRRIGLSMAGVTQNIEKQGLREHFKWCDNGYNYLRKLDDIYSDWLCVPRSKKITAIKPGGTTPLLPGVTPGIHYSLGGKYYYRTMRFGNELDLLLSLKKAGYRIEKAEGHNTSVVYFPVEEANCTKSIKEASVWEQVEIAAQMQYWWADNQVSVTIQFKEEEADQIPLILQLYETRLKSISFLPSSTGSYKHPPYQPISKKEYEKAIKKLKPVKIKNSIETLGFEHTFCDSDGCDIAAK